jgi:hypothetical protein
MPGETAGVNRLCRGGSSDPPRGSAPISNRDTERLEKGLSRRKHGTQPDSNRDKNALFQRRWLQAERRSRKAGGHEALPYDAGRDISNRPRNY